MGYRFNHHYFTISSLLFIVLPLIALFALFMILERRDENNVTLILQQSYSLERQISENTNDSPSTITLEIVRQQLLEGIQYYPYSAPLWIRLADIENKRHQKQNSEKAKHIALSLNPSIHSLLPFKK